HAFPFYSLCGCVDCTTRRRPGCLKLPTTGRIKARYSTGCARCAVPAADPCLRQHPSSQTGVIAMATSTFVLAETRLPPSYAALRTRLNDDREAREEQLRTLTEDSARD